MMPWRRCLTACNAGEHHLGEWPSQALTISGRCADGGAGMRQRLAGVSLSPIGCDSKAIHAPVDDHDGALSSCTVSRVTRTGVPPPADTTKILAAGSSPRSEEYTIRAPSGDQLASVSLDKVVTTARRLVPSGAMVYKFQSSVSGRRRWKSMRSPRGDQLGCRSSIPSPGQLVN